jgi:hypothetical protein
MWEWLLLLAFGFCMPGKYFSNLSLLVCVYLWLWGMFLVDNRLLDLAFWSNQTICVFWLESLVPLHLELWLRGIYWFLCFYCFFSRLNLVLIVPYFGYCSPLGFADVLSWTYLILSYLSWVHQFSFWILFYSFLAFCVYKCFYSICVNNIPLSSFCNSDLVALKDFTIMCCLDPLEKGSIAP